MTTDNRLQILGDVTKKKRQEVLVKLVKENQIKLQDDFSALLKKLGIDDISPATLSRDLKEAKIAKDITKGYYTLSAEHYLNKSKERLQRAVQDDVELIYKKISSFAIKTVPGYAKSTATLIEKSYPDKVLGTIAGDDMVLVITGDSQTAEDISTMMLEMGQTETI